METTKLELKTVNELAGALKVPKSWIYDKTRKNEIPMIRVGKYLRFDMNEVLEWLKNREQF